jgi:ribonuclease PH
MLIDRNKMTSDINTSEIHLENLTRKDGRRYNDMQEIFLQKGIKKDCTSSVYLETNHLKMISTINGPIYQTNIAKSKTDEAGKMNVIVNVFIPSYYSDMKINCNKNTIELQLEELFTKNIFVEKYARTKLVINIEIFEFNCDILPFAIMATTLALCYANIEQKGIISCANVIYIADGNKIISDPTFEEEEYSNSKITFGCIIDLQENNLFIQNGSIEDENEYKRALGTAIKMCEAYQNFLISKL